MVLMSRSKPQRQTRRLIFTRYMYRIALSEHSTLSSLQSILMHCGQHNTRRVSHTYVLSTFEIDWHTHPYD